MIVRGIDTPPQAIGFRERMPSAAELMALAVQERVAVIWTSGVHPNTSAMAAVFLSVADEPGHGMFIAACVQTGLPPNPKFYRGEGRFDSLVWPDGFPFFKTKTKVSPRLRKPPRVEREVARRAFEREAHLFTLLACGCVEDCLGPVHHAAIEAERERPARELAEAQSNLADLLSREMQRQIYGRQD